jgi:hypothetical protein
MRGLLRSFVPAVGIGISFVIALGCGGHEVAPPPGLDEVQLAGWRVYVDLECASCHGDGREGRRSGPALTGLADHWTAEQLVSYLIDPDAVVRANPRLAYKAEKYAIGMPKVSGKTPGYGEKAHDDKLAALAAYLLVDIQSP